jgi:hypothetical protein
MYETRECADYDKLLQSKVIPIHAMKVWREGKATSPLICNFGTTAM